MKNNGCFSQLHQLAAAARMGRAAGALVAALAIAVAGPAVAQDTNPTAPAPESRITVPEGYTLHHAIDVGGRIPIRWAAARCTIPSSICRAAHAYRARASNSKRFPKRAGPLSSMTSVPLAPVSAAIRTTSRARTSEGKVYEFGNLPPRPPVHGLQPARQSQYSGGAVDPDQRLDDPEAWQQYGDSTFLYNTVRRMTDTNLTCFRCRR